MTQTSQGHGSMIVVAEDAACEANRLCKQGTRIVPTKLTESLLRSVSGIDGTILLDPAGLCHAIGIILDGEATDECTPSRDLGIIPECVTYKRAALEGLRSSCRMIEQSISFLKSSDCAVVQK